MTDATTQTEGQGSFQLLIDPVYGPIQSIFGQEGIRTPAVMSYLQ